MLYAIPFPAFDPVLVHFGPVAIRWYALAYIAGILAGWLYARALIRNPTYWGGTAPMTVVDFDDFVLWVTLGIILGGRIGYVLFYNLSYFIANPTEIVQLWKGGMSFHGGFLGCVAAVILFARLRGIPVLSLGDITCAAGRHHRGLCARLRGDAHLRRAVPRAGCAARLSLARPHHGHAAVAAADALRHRPHRGGAAACGRHRTPSSAGTVSGT